MSKHHNNSSNTKLAPEKQEGAKAGKADLRAEAAQCKFPGRKQTKESQEAQKSLQKAYLEAEAQARKNPADQEELTPSQLASLLM